MKPIILIKKSQKPKIKKVSIFNKHENIFLCKQSSRFYVNFRFRGNTEDIHNLELISQRLCKH